MKPIDQLPRVTVKTAGDPTLDVQLMLRDCTTAPADTVIAMAGGLADEFGPAVFVQIGDEARYAIPLHPASFTALILIAISHGIEGREEIAEFAALLKDTAERAHEASKKAVS